ncbi:hypothetical protein [Gloeothece verrucosa]|uniref:hypothetical protein n=1 Tax=Gloeothece verrucosa TaxID=2546359 RepID=UPI003CCA9685
MFVKNLKSSSSRLLRKEFELELSKTYSKPVLWSSSPQRYFGRRCAIRSSQEVYPESINSVLNPALALIPRTPLRFVRGFPARNC